MRCKGRGVRDSASCNQMEWVANVREEERVKKKGREMGNGLERVWQSGSWLRNLR